ncbi:LexA family transcriptional regulator [Dehalococcoides mccartyi]|uniref:LexA family transcriptional regulator n=1 Tax=Dehalococcoides mccartyi TaxID=61435 RepID=UPI0019DCE9BA|nr:LexA family transcriptional regulator [Dehalococcoides mccartyi]MBF4483082.1 LexA family transcriptional regulator [Dehalococcoides mccartyi]MBJ7531919.1 LexA family transcriptional regulator [Dehalococcoides mccartyi]
MNNLPHKIKSLRVARGWSQQQLADKVGVPRTNISQLEQGRRPNPSVDKLMQFANVFNINIDELYEALGISNSTTAIPLSRPESPEEILERLRLATPMSIPVYSEFRAHAGNTGFAPVDYIYRTRVREAPRHNIESYIVSGKCMEPKIENGDIVIVDRDMVPEIGDIVLCLIDDELRVAKIIEQNGECILKNGQGTHSVKECQAIAVIIEVTKRLKH